VNYFIWKSLLVLNIQQPLTLKTNSDLWISSKDFVRVQSLSGQVTISPLKLGQFFMSGAKLQEKNLPDPLEVIITTDRNFKTLQKCKENLSFQNGELFVEDNFLEKEIRAECSFDRLSLKNIEPSSQIQNLFLEEENKIKKKHPGVGLGQWKDGRRLLYVFSSSNLNLLKKSFSPKLLPFYDFTLRNESLPGNNLIFELTLFEFSRNRAQNLGVSWPQNISMLKIDSNGASALKLGSTGASKSGELIIGADFGESQGVGRVLSRPTLRTKPGKESRFHSGGEFPIRNKNAFHSETTWKSYGLKVSLTPNENTLPGDREVSLAFKMEFSEPHPDLGIEGIPGLLQRQLESHFDLRMNEQTVLTTMLTLRESKAKEGLYFFSQVPILSLFFAENAENKNDSELWFSLKPTWDEITNSSKQNDSLKLEGSA
jgi:hypothetical protein